MKFVQEGYQRGPVHVGFYEMNWRVYPWGPKEIQKYKEMKEEENLMLMGDLSGSVMQSMEALGDELKRYLKEADGINETEKTEGGKVNEKKSILERAFGDFIDFKKKSTSKNKKIEGKKLGNGYLAIMAPSWLLYKNFKKSHRMITW